MQLLEISWINHLSLYFVSEISVQQRRVIGLKVTLIDNLVKCESESVNIHVYIVHCTMYSNEVRTAGKELGWGGGGGSEGKTYPLQLLPGKCLQDIPVPQHRPPGQQY